MARKDLGVKNSKPDLYQLRKEGLMTDVNSDYATGFPLTPFPKIKPALTYGAAVPLGEAGLVVPANKAAYIKGINIGTDSKVAASISIQAGPFSTGGPVGTAKSFQVIVNPGNTFIEIENLLYENGTFSCRLFSLSTDDLRPYCTVDVDCFFFTADFDYDSPFTVLNCGDSITYGYMGSNPDTSFVSGKYHYTRLLKEKLKDFGLPNRHINKGAPSSKTTDFIKGLDVGYYDGIPYDLLTIAYGMNDASGTPTLSEYSANLYQAILHRNRNRPNAPIIFIAPNVTDSAGLVSNIAGYRNAMRQLVISNGGATNKLYFYDTSQAFALNATASADLNFASTDRTAGNRVHPSGVGHGLMFENGNADSHNGTATGGIWPVVKKALKL